VPAWPGGARGALSLSFDNLGEAAELELGAFPAGAPLGEHFTATRVLPQLLETLRAHELVATFFVEGVNAELYPEALAAIVAAGHELGYHAWRHEQWGELTAAEQADNLARGRAAFAALDRRSGAGLAGMRPPGGQLGAGGAEVLRAAGLSYCSPAGAGAGIEDGVAMLPFQWRHVDASCVLPPLAPVRKAMTGSADPLEPEAFVTYLGAEIEQLRDSGGFLGIVLHLFMVDWLGEQRLAALLERLALAAREDAIWVAPCRDIAAHVLGQPDSFGADTALDSTSWGG